MTSPEENYLLPSLTDLFQKVELLRGYLLHIESDLSKYLEIQSRRLDELYGDNPTRNSMPFLLKYSGLVISDLTGPSDKGWEINYPLPTNGYVVYSSNYKEKVDKLIQLLSATFVAQSYEALETFFKSTLIQFFQYNEPTAFNTIGRINCKIKNNEVDWGKTVNTLRQGINNEEFLKIFRSLSQEFIEAETNNNKSLNLDYWYNAFSIARHAIVHSNLVIKSDVYNRITAEEHEILKTFFGIEKNIDNNYNLNISAKKAADILDLVCEYSFLIFKCLSKINEIDWKVLRRMK